MPAEHSAEQTSARRAPVLLLIADPEVVCSMDILGEATSSRMSEAALAAGFAAVFAVSGVRVTPQGARDLPLADELGVPALVAYESTFVHPELLRLMVEHPLGRDESFTLYDAFGRPAALFTGWLSEVPDIMPMAEEIAWPEPMGPADVVRLVYREDVIRMEALVLRALGLIELTRVGWQRSVVFPALRWLANRGTSVARLEFAVLTMSVSTAPFCLLETAFGLPLGALCMLFAVQLGRILEPLAKLRGGNQSPTLDVPSRTRIGRAARPLTHAFLAAALTYRLVDDSERSGVAALLLLFLGASMVLFSLWHARKLLHGAPSEALELPDVQAIARRLGIALPTWIEGAPVVELMVVLVTLAGEVELPWTVLVGIGAARIWRWYVGPVMP